MTRLLKKADLAKCKMSNYPLRRRKRIATTLLELILSMAAVTVLLAGMSSAIFLAHQAATPASTPASAINGSLAAADMADELKFATQLINGQPTTVQFQRIRTATTEQITYAWSGVAGEPLTRSVDAGTPVNFAEKVHHFQLVYLPSPDPSPNLLNNPGGEDGIDDWSGFSCDIESSSVSFHGGSRSLRAYNRTSSAAGPRQFVTRKIRNGTPYRVEAWLRISAGAQTPQVSLNLMTTSGLLAPVTFSTSAISTNWVKVSGVLTPTWAGELRWAYLKISTTGTPDLYCDDMTMTEAGTGTPVALDRIGIEIQLGPNSQSRTAISTRLLHHPILWQP